MKKKQGRRPVELIIRKRRLIEKLFMILFIVNLISIPLVGVNYDLTKYLPDDAPSAQALDIMEAEFTYPGMGRVMLKDVTIHEAKVIKDRIADVDGVDMILWCDAAVNIYGSSEFIDYSNIEDYYKDGYAVMDVTFVEGDASKRTSQAINEMREITGDKGYFVGMAVQSKSLAEKVAEEMKLILSLGVFFIFLILCITTTSWFEPVLFLSVMAVAIGEDGNICNACSSSAGGEITYSKSGSDDEESWWDLRMARHAEFMKLAVEKQIQRHIQASELAASAAAKSQLAAMLTGGNLREIFGSEIAGIPTETVLAITQAQVWGGGAIL